MAASRIKEISHPGDTKQSYLVFNLVPCRWGHLCWGAKPKRRFIYFQQPAQVPPAEQNQVSFKHFLIAVFSNEQC
jgi:hypothetical protein